MLEDEPTSRRGRMPARSNQKVLKGRQNLENHAR